MRDRAHGDHGAGRLGESVEFPALLIELPGWVRRHVDWTRLYIGDRDRMRVALMLARWNVEQKTGGPFGAAVFEVGSGRLVAVGVNRVAPDRSTLLHAETVAIALAEQRYGAPGLARPDMPALELHTSCEPCLMCAGAITMCGVPRVVSGATVSDAAAVGIDGGAAPAAVWEMLRERGTAVRHEVLRDEARAVFALWRAAVGPGTR
jgi:tRNA(Arg) A34 adenosine deaminase TadA